MRISLRVERKTFKVNKIYWIIKIINVPIAFKYYYYFILYEYHGNKILKTEMSFKYLCSSWNIDGKNE